MEPIEEGSGPGVKHDPRCQSLFEGSRTQADVGRWEGPKGVTITVTGTSGLCGDDFGSDWMFRV